MLRRRPRSDATVGVTVHPDGLALTQVAAGSPSATPRVVRTEFVACAPDERQASLAAAVKRHRLERVPCTLALEPPAYHLLQVEAPDVESSELRSAVRWRIKDLLDFHVDDAVIDVFDLPDQRQAGQATMMYAVAAREATIRERIGLIEGAGLSLSAIDITELALRNLVALTPEDTDGLATLTFFDSGGLLILSREGTLYLSRAIDLDTGSGSATGGVAAPALTPGPDVEHLSLELQRSFDYYESFFGMRPVSGIVLTPGGPATPQLATSLQDALGVSARHLDLGELLAPDAELDPQTQARCLVALGAALRAEETAL